VAGNRTSFSAHGILAKHRADDYSGRSEAGLVMASTGKVDTGTMAPFSATLMGYKESK